jgi:glutamate-1-semialdehyde 2,1-aminomutase
MTNQFQNYKNCGNDIHDSNYRNDTNYKSKVNTINAERAENAKISRNVFSFHTDEELSKFHKRVNQIIPSGAHTFAKSDDRYPHNAPKFVYRGKNGHIWDTQGKEFIDWGMGCRSVLLGHAYEPVINAVKRELSYGCNFARPSYIENNLAELMLKTIKGYDMCKFGKNGSDATTAAVRLARATTKRNKVVICNKTFFSINDWYIGATPMSAGIPSYIQNMTLMFKYNDLESLKKIFDENENQIACVIMEVTRDEEPKPGFLQGVRQLCNANNTLLIFDEIVTGFRYNLNGAQSLFGVTADLTTFGKSMANGFAISALLGKEEYMQRGGSINNRDERVFLLSQTYGGETHSIAAAIASINEFTDKNVSSHVYKIGNTIKDGINNLSKELGLQQNFSSAGYGCTPTVSYNLDGNPSAELQTLFVENILKKDNIIFPPLGPSFTHTNEDVQRTLIAIEHSMATCKKSIENNSVKQDIQGNILKSPLRKFN